jgi:hypothetical protein
MSFSHGVPVSENPFAPYKARINSLVNDFEDWMSQSRNQIWFNSLQSAFKGWLNEWGFSSVEGDYSTAVAVLLTYLSLCLANPMHRRYLSNPEAEEWTVVQVNVPEPEDFDDDHTFWEFFTEENFQKMYSDWRQRHPQRL